MSVRAKFFKSGEQDLVEIKIAGQDDTVIEKVNPKHLEDYPREWAAYQAGEKQVDYGGTPLTEVPGLNDSAAVGYRLKGIHNAEMLAEASDATVSRLGMGAGAFRKSAQNLLDANEHRSKKAAAKPTADDKQADKVADADKKRAEGDEKGVQEANKAAEDALYKEKGEFSLAAAQGGSTDQVTTESLQNQRAAAAIVDKRK